MSTSVAGVYALVNLLNGHKYVGSSKNCSKRHKEHVAALKNGKHFNKHLQAAFNKYGPDVWYFMVLAEVEESGLLDIENALICTGHYNVAPRAGCGPGPKSPSPLRGRKLSSEHIAKIKATKRQTCRKPEYRAMRSASQKGRRLTIETRNKLRVARLGRSTTKVRSEARIRQQTEVNYATKP